MYTIQHRESNPSSIYPSQECKSLNAKIVLAMSRVRKSLSLLLLNLFLSIFILIATIVESLTLPSNIKALEAFKNSIKPSSIPSYSCLATWDFTTDPCTLPHRIHFTCGLTCTRDSTQISSLVLDPIGYTGSLSPFISLLTQLTIVDLSENNFYGAIPASLSSLSNLHTLILRMNYFSGQIPNSITKLKSLKTLDFSRNSLSGSLPISMNLLWNLRRLDLSFNGLSGSLPNLPKNLLELAIKNNSLSGSIQKSSFYGLNQLEVIELSWNLFAGTIQSWFFLLPELQQVNLGNNRLTSVEVSKPNNGISDLIAVDLGFNNITGYVPVNFYYYPLLSTLTLRHNQLRGPIPAEYSQKETLKRLFLDGNFLNGKVPEKFFSGSMDSFSGSLGDNCLQSCPTSSRLCLPSQKSTSVCRQAYGGKPMQ